MESANGAVEVSSEIIPPGPWIPTRQAPWSPRAASWMLCLTVVHGNESRWVYRACARSSTHSPFVGNDAADIEAFGRVDNEELADQVLGWVRVGRVLLW